MGSWMEADWGFLRIARQFQENRRFSASSHCSMCAPLRLGHFLYARALGMNG